MKTKHSIFLLLIIAVFLAGCPSATLEPYKREKCTDMPSDKVFAALQDNCVSCHKKDFNTKEDICTRKSLIIDAVRTGRMPKMGKLYEHYKKTLVEWE